MKPQILNLLPKESLVISSLIFLLLFSCKSTSYAQNDKVDLYYQEIIEIVSESLKPNSKQDKLLNAYISSDKYSKEEIENYKQDIENRNNKLYYKQSNALLINFLKEKKALEYFEKTEIADALKTLKNELEIEKTQLPNYVEIFKEGYGHFFSTPVFLKNKMILLHSLSISKLVSHSQLLIYNLNDNEIKIEKIISIN